MPVGPRSGKQPRGMAPPAMNAHTVFQVQELCDSIADHLHGFKWDLRACSLISRPLTSAAQRSLFHDIILNRGAYGIDELGILDRVDEAGPCKRLCAVLRDSPHLINYVRRIRGAFEPDVLQPLCEVEFPSLRALVLHRRRPGAATAELISLAALILATPSLERFGLLYPIFATMGDLAKVFEKHSPNLSSLWLFNVNVQNRTPAGDLSNAPPRVTRVVVKDLHTSDVHYQYDQEWLLDEDCPLDLSQLEELNCGERITPVVRKIIKHARKSLTRLTVDADYAVDAEVPASYFPDVLSPSHLPALEKVTITTGRGLRDAATLLSALSHSPHSETRLQSLILQIKSTRIDSDALRAVAEMWLELHLPGVVTVKLPASRLRQQEGMVKGAFAELEEQGRLRIAAA